MQEMMKAKAIELLQNGTVQRVVGWKAGDFVYDITPAVFETAEEIGTLIGKDGKGVEDLQTAGCTIYVTCFVKAASKI